LEHFSALQLSSHQTYRTESERAGGRWHHNRGEMVLAMEHARRAVTEATNCDDRMGRVAGHQMVGILLFAHGDDAEGGLVEVNKALELADGCDVTRALTIVVAATLKSMTDVVGARAGTY
jgi:hypothetical protein